MDKHGQLKLGLPNENDYVTLSIVCNVGAVDLVGLFSELAIIYTIDGF